MKAPVATSRERSASVSVSDAGGGGKTYGKMKKPSATPNAVPARPPNKNTTISRKNLRIDPAPGDRTAGRPLHQDHYVRACSEVTPTRNQSALGSRRMVNSMQSSGSSRQLSISVW